jgi:hypothetical protein
MADDNSKSWTLLKGIGGIASAVITALLIYYFTRPPATPPTIAFEGLVSNVASHNPVPNANVTVSIGSNSVQQKTDAEGRYSVILNGTGDTSMGTVAIDATGYEPYSNTVAFTSGENFAEIPIEAASSATSNQPPAANAPTANAPVENAPAGKPIILKTPPSSYKKKNEIAYQTNLKK